MADADRPQKNTARVRRGYALVIRELLCDSDYSLFDPRAPWIRRYRAGDRRDICAAIRFMEQQNKRPAAARRTRRREPDQPPCAQGADPCSMPSARSSPTSVTLWPTKTHHPDTEAAA